MINKIKFFLDKFPIIKKPVVFLYTNSIGRIIYYRENRNFRKHSKDTLLALDSVFRGLSIPYWLDFGTLLGAVREKDFIQHDLDIDVGMWLLDRTPLLQKSLEEAGFRKIRDITIYRNAEVYGLEETYSLNGINVDIFYYTKIDSDKAYYHDFIPLPGVSRIGTINKLGGLVPREITLPIKGIQDIEFKGAVLSAPYPVEEHLIGRYGESYMIKDSNWSITKGNQQSVKVLSDDVGIINYL